MEKNIESLSLNTEGPKEDPKGEKNPSISSVAVDDLLKHLRTPDAYEGPEKQEDRLPKPSEKVDEEKLRKEISEVNERQKEREQKKETSREKPEEQKPIDAKFDLDAAKKRIEELYGSGVEVVDKSIPAEKPVETSSTEKKPEKNLEQIKAEEEQLEEAKKEKTKDELINTAKKIEEARANKQKEAESSLYEKAVEPYREITGENLKEKSKEKAKIEAEKEGLKLMTKQEFLSEKRIKDTEEKVKQREWSAAISYRWSNLSDKERARYIGENGKQDISKFATELEEKRQGLAKKGINLSRDAYYQMMKEGLQPDQMKIRGFWGRLFIGSQIEVASLYWKEPLNMSKKELGNWAIKSEARSIDYAKREAQRELDQKVVEGQKRWRGKKQKCTRDLIGEVVQKIEIERREKEQAKKKEAVQKPKIEISSRKEMEKIRKQVEADIKKRKEAQKKIQDLIKKRKKNKLLTPEEIAYLNSFAEQEEKQAA